MKDELVRHRGVVQQVGDSYLKVKILQTSGCSSCIIKAHCSSADSKEHLIDVTDANASLYHSGDEVLVVGTTSMGKLAVWYGFVLPFLIVIAALFAFTTWLEDELVAGLCALACLLPYYFALYLCKDKMKRTFSFSVMPLDDENNQQIN